MLIHWAPKPLAFLSITLLLRLRPPPPFGGGTGTIKNEKTWIGWNLCLCGVTKKKSRLTPNPNPGPAPSSPPGGPSGGSSQFFPPGQTVPIGTGGCAPCAGVVIVCSTGIAVLHFTSGDDPGGTVDNYTWPAGCKAIVCGSDDSKESNCLHDGVLSALKSAGITVDTVQPNSACGVNPDGTWYATGT